jgi:hypothetical protein
MVTLRSYTQAVIEEKKLDGDSTKLHTSCDSEQTDSDCERTLTLCVKMPLL